MGGRHEQHGGVLARPICGRGHFITAQAPSPPQLIVTTSILIVLIIQEENGELGLTPGSLNIGLADHSSNVWMIWNSNEG
jgi:hypothetical protein